MKHVAFNCIMEKKYIDDYFVSLKIWVCYACFPFYTVELPKWTFPWPVMNTSRLQRSTSPHYPPRLTSPAFNFLVRLPTAHTLSWKRGEWQKERDTERTGEWQKERYWWRVSEKTESNCSQKICVTSLQCMLSKLKSTGSISTPAPVPLGESWKREWTMGERGKVNQVRMKGKRLINSSSNFVSWM